MNQTENSAPVSDLHELAAISRRVRGRIIEMSHRAKTPHLGSSLSCVDIVVAAYWGVLKIDPQKPGDPLRDRFILSKGHAATTLYAALAFRGFFPESELDDYNCNGGKLAEHPSPNSVPGIEAATGSLGHGLSIGIGMALAGRIKKQDYRVYVLLSDGECNEGSVWEAAMMAPAHGLNRVCAIIDYNKWQATGRSNEILALQDLKAKWSAFQWHTHEVDGNNLAEVVAAMKDIPNSGGKPVAIIAHTVKGKGISFMEDDNNWHYRIPNADEVAAAREQLGLA